MENRKILIIDDDHEIWRAYRDVLNGTSGGPDSSSRQIADLLVGEEARKKGEIQGFSLTFASQGQLGFAKVQEALAEKSPFAVAFIDIRMPPGWDGMETAAQIRHLDANIEIVIVTAFSDRSRQEIVDTVGVPEKLLFLRKPFDPEELYQLALSLSEKWNIGSQEKMARKALKRSEERLRALVETSSDFVWETDSEGRFTYCSPVGELIYGFRPEELVGNCFADLLLPPESAEDARSFLRYCVQEVKDFHGLERLCRRKSGEAVFIEASGTPVIDNNGRVIGFRGIDRDVTARKKNETERLRLEEQFRQSQKMEALGTLSGGIAHDLNNVLTPIMGNAQLAMLELSKDHHLYGNLADILKSAEKAAGLIRQILIFSRKQVVEYKALNINRLIDNLYKMLRRLISTDIELVLDLKEGLWDINGDAGQTEQILMNLVVNSRDALGEGGQITIRTRNRSVSDGELYDTEHRPIVGDFIELSVSDDGSGMDVATRERIFDPFFTTKEVGKGTGLGLSTVYGIVSQQQGHIRLESDPGLGATFYIYFRKSEKEAAVEGEAVAQRVKGGSETVLVVEDTREVRAVTVSILRKFGYQVLEAVNGNDAMRVIGCNRGRFDLLLTDIVMPGLGGRALAATLRESLPDLPVILMSAYPPDVVLNPSEDEKQRFSFIQKPFSPQDLARKIREKLDS